MKENMENLTEINELWSGKNKIRLLQNLSHLLKLRLLSIQSNRLTSIGDGLRYNVQLKELYLSHNGFEVKIMTYIVFFSQSEV